MAWTIHSKADSGYAQTPPSTTACSCTPKTKQAQALQAQTNYKPELYEVSNDLFFDGA